MKILGIIPARYASTRFPGKPLINIMDKPMIQHVYEKSSEILKNLVVATDDQRIYDAVINFGGEVVLTSSHHQSGTDRCAEALKIYENQNQVKIDAIINIQGDEPFINASQIKQIAELLENNAELATLVKPIEETSVLFDENKPKVVLSQTMDALYFSRQAIPFLKNTPQADWLKARTYYQHIGLYGYSKNALLNITKLPKGDLEEAESLEQLRWLENGYTIKTATTQLEGISIDTPEDLEALLKKIR